MTHRSSKLKLGLRANWQQFTLLVAINAFVGAMIGLERTILPLIAEADFGLVSRTVVLSFLISCGLVKPLATGYLAATYGFRPVPFLPGFLFAALDLLLSLLFVRDTREFVRLEAELADAQE